MVKVGIIANPASGKDIRRLVAHGSVFDNNEKVNIVRRIILALESLEIDEVLVMPDTYGIGERAIDGLSKLRIPVRLISMPVTGQAIDSTVAAELMREAKVGCIVTLGGDGTNRDVAKRCGEVPILPVSTGTNNVFSYMVEGTVAGLAAAVIAKRVVNLNKATIKSKRLNIIKNRKRVDIALVDVVVYDESFKGSRAIWNVAKMKEIVTTRGEPKSIGTSSIIGLVHPIKVEDDRGIHLILGEGKFQVKAPIAPGLIKTVEIKEIKVMHLNDKVKLSYKPAILALDGEREVEIYEDDEVEIQLDRRGPVIVNLERTMEEAAKMGIFTKYL